jgi:hypothetical protein
MKTTAEYFTIATRKNALRKEAHLPLLNIRDEIARQKYIDYAAEYGDVWESHKVVYDKICVLVREELIGQHGGDWKSVGGITAIHAIAKGRMEDYLRNIGFNPPKKEENNRK